MTVVSNIDPNLLEPAAALAMSKYIEALATTSTPPENIAHPPVALQYSIAVSLKRIGDILEEMMILGANRKSDRSEKSEQSAPLV